MVITCGEVPPPAVPAGPVGVALLLCVLDIDRARMGDCLEIDGKEGRRQRRLAECRPARRAKDAAIVIRMGNARGEEAF
jgi:hypothetical protein